MSGTIVVKGVGKKYKHYPNKWARLGEWLTGGQRVFHEARWVLRDVSFTVSSGESVGIIGRNGAGKSTLLKLLTKTSLPNQGLIAITGRVSALLELGMGAHMDFSGRVNAKMTCQMMGLSTEESHALLPKIAEFSELGEYFDKPMRIYSTGMQVRLAFSAATAVRPEILMVDEALSVGDAYFQHKCIERIRQYREMGTTLLFVSHDPGAVKSLCQRALLLEGGHILQDGPADAILDYYNASIARSSGSAEIKQVQGNGGVATRSGSGKVCIEQVDLFDEAGQPINAFTSGSSVVVVCRVHFLEQMTSPTIGILFRDRMGNEVYGTNTFHLRKNIEYCEQGETLEARFTVKLNIGQGNYSLSVAVHPGDSHLIENCAWWDRCQVFQVVAGAGPSFVGVAALPVNAEIQRIGDHD